MRIRLNQLAKELGVKNNDLVAKAVAMGMEAKSHSSTVDNAQAAALRAAYGKPAGAPAPAAATPAQAPPPAAPAPAKPRPMPSGPKPRPPVLPPCLNLVRQPSQRGTDPSRKPPAALAVRSLAQRAHAFDQADVSQLCPRALQRSAGDVVLQFENAE